jgi:hypothetical protein
MNTSLNLNITSIAQIHPSVASKPIPLTGLPRWIRIIARFFVYSDDPAAIRYIKGKYERDWD